MYRELTAIFRLFFHLSDCKISFKSTSIIHTHIHIVRPLQECICWVMGVFVVLFTGRACSYIDIPREGVKE